MKLADIKSKAADLGIAVGKSMKKPDVIRAIQKAEGNAGCYDTGVKDCPYTGCCWWGDCMG